MPTKFCDPTLYLDGEVVASITGTTLTVSSITSGVIGIGSTITGDGVAADTYISGGAHPNWTVNVSQTVASTTMKAYGMTPLTTPTWGEAQEGDGLAKGKATPAVVSINLTGTSAAAGNTFTVLGATLTCVASGAGNNQFNAGSGSTLAANLAAAINRAGNTVTLAAQDTGWATPKIQDAVFARATGATLEIMTRAGSAVYNGKTATHSGFTSAVGAPWSFSGGASGAWMGLFNPLPYWPSAVGAGGYGLWTVGALLAGAVAAGDDVKVRMGNRRLYTLSNNNILPSLPAQGTRSSPVRYWLDDGTEWPADGAMPRTIHRASLTGPFRISFLNAACFVDVRGRQYSQGEYSLHIVTTHGNTTSGSGGQLQGGAPSRVEGISAESDHPTAPPQSFIAGGTNDRTLFVRCRAKSARATGGLLVLATGTNSTTYCAVQDCVLDNTGNATPHPGVVEPNGSSTGDQFLEAQGVKFVGFVVGSELCGSLTSTRVPQWTFDGCDFGNVTKRGPYLGVLTLTGKEQRLRQIALIGRDAKREFMYDNLMGHAQWNPLRSFPTCAARLDDAAQTPWSILAIPSSTEMDSINPFTLPRLGKRNTLGAGNRTVTVRFCAEQSITPTENSVSMLVCYRDASGSLVVIDTWSVAGTISTDTTAWSSMSGAQVTWDLSGTVLLNRWKLQVTTSVPVPADAEVFITPRLHQNVANAAQVYFFDPELGLA